MSDGKIHPRKIIGKVSSVFRKNKSSSVESLSRLRHKTVLEEASALTRLFESRNVRHVMIQGIPVYSYITKQAVRHVDAGVEIIADSGRRAEIQKIMHICGYRQTNAPHKEWGNRRIICYHKKTGTITVQFTLYFNAVFPLETQDKYCTFLLDDLSRMLSYRLLEHSVKIKVAGRPFYLPDRDHMVIYLLLRFFYNNYHGVYLFRQLGILLKKNAGDALPVSLNKKIQEYRLENYIGAVMKIIKGRQNILEICSETSLLRSQIYRLKNLLMISPRPWKEKIRVLLNPHIFFLPFRILFRRMKRLPAAITDRKGG
jgi:hypothetical protein